MCWFFIGCGSTDLVIIFSIHILVLHMDFFFHESKSFFEPLVRLFEESLYAMSWIRSSYILLVFLHMDLIFINVIVLYNTSFIL